MRPQKQLFLHEPEKGIYGDCHRTAIACLLDMDVEFVPHFLHDGTKDGEVFDRRETEFLNSIGYHKIRIPFVFDQLKPLLEFMQAMNPGVYYLLGGMSPRGVAHTVIACGDKLVWDPHPSDSFLTGLLRNEALGNEFNYFEVSIIIPLSMLKRD